MKLSSRPGKLSSMSTVGQGHSARGIVPLFFALTVALLSGTNSEAQMLARPGWQGSGLTTEGWWHRPVVYEIDARTFAADNADGVTGLKGVVEHLDYLRALGVDAILLDALNPPATAGTADAKAATDHAPVLAPPIDPSLGTLDDFDTLSLEASRRNIRVLLNLPASGSEATDLATARFWLNRGVAGFHLVPAAGQTIAPTTVTALHQLLHSFYGGRILVVDAAPAAATTADQTAGAEGGGHTGRHTRTGSTQGSGSSSATQPVLMPSLLKISSPATALSQQQAAVAIATQLHAALEESLSLPANQLPLLLTDSASEPPSVTRLFDALGNPATAQSSAEQKQEEQRQIAKLVATVLLGTRAAALEDQGQEIGLTADASSTASAGSGALSPSIAMPWQPPAAAKPTHALATAPKQPLPNTVATEDADPASLLNFYRQLSQLHHGNSAMRDGEMQLLDHSAEGVVAWVRRPRTPSLLTPAVVVLLNLSATPTTLSLKAELTKLQLRGSFLRSVLRSDSGMGSMNLTSMTLPPFTVYIGEVRY